MQKRAQRQVVLAGRYYNQRKKACQHSPFEVKNMERKYVCRKRIG